MEISGFLGGFCLAEPLGETSGFLGGFCLSKVVDGNEIFAILGGFIQGPFTADPSGFIGGFCQSLPVTDDGPEFIGGHASGLNTITESLGGFGFGKPDAVRAAITRARTLVAVTSDNVAGQRLEFDAKIVFKGFADNDLNAKFINIHSFFNDVTAKFEVQKFKMPPTVSILSVDLVPGSGESLPSGQPVPNFDPSGTRQVCVTASGELGDGDEFINVQFNFSDPFQKTNDNFKQFLSVSGTSGPPPWTFCHDYNMSGIYNITVRAQDNLGLVGSNVSGLNLASGASFGNDFPAISISGVPRSGTVPPSLGVDFFSASSGVFVPPYTAKQSTASKIRSPTDQRILWMFGNRERSRRSAPSTNYNNPGLYVPILVMKYTNPSGTGPFIISDSLLVGFNSG